MYRKYAKYFLKLVELRMLNKAAPLEATIAITNRCNINCVYCYGNYPERNDKDIPLETIKALIDEMVSMGLRFVHISGGEALLRKDVGEILEHVKKKGILLEIITNGVLTRKYIPLLRRTIDFICISIDGNEEITDQNRGKGVYANALETVRACRDAGIITRVNGVLSEKTVDTVEHLILLAKKENFLLSFNLPYGSMSDDRTKSMPFNDQKMREGLGKIVYYKKQGYPINFSAKTYEYVMNWPVSLAQCKLDRAFIDKIGFHNIPCYYGKYICVIDANGDVYPCTHRMADSRFTPKNYVTDGFKAAWENLSIDKDCISCTDLSFTEHNQMFSLKPSTIISQVRNVIRL